VNPSARMGTAIQMVTPEYVDTMGIRMVSGRNINESDTATSVRVATVNEHFVKQYLAGLDPLTQRISFQFIPAAPRGVSLEWQIVGVYHNLRGAGFREDIPEINIPFAQAPFPQASMAVKTSSDPKTVINSIAAAVNSVDPDLPLAGVRTIDEIVSESLAIDRFSVVLFASFGALGLLLAAVGIYGVISFAVAQRTHEFGVRMALGAQRSRVISQVLREGTILALCGTVIGLGGAYLVGRAMQSTLFGVEAFDVRAFTAVSLLLLLAALLACLFPAWRASRVEPLEALRYE
jgi:putative ABC transport system permease protein